jgi:hypothetical protein
MRLSWLAVCVLLLHLAGSVPPITDLTDSETEVDPTRLPQPKSGKRTVADDRATKATASRKQTVADDALSDSGDESSKLSNCRADCC